MSKRILTAVLILILPAVVWAAMPQPTGFVTDSAGVLDRGTKTKLENFLRSFEKQTGVEVAVATVSSLDEQPIEDYAVELYKKWGIGKKGKDNGVLFLIAPKEKKMRIEVGYGLEGAINDAMAGRIMDTVVLPQFKEGNMSGGIAMGTLSIVDAVVTRENLPFDPSKEIAEYEQLARTKKKGGPLRTAGKVIVFIILAFVFIRHPWLFLFFLGSMMGGRGGGSGGGFGGGFGGFGGGLSGGGGASRGW